jgi:hypothetical protein
MELAERLRGLSDLAAVDVCEQLAAAMIADVAVPDVLGEPLLAPDSAALGETLAERYHEALPPTLSVELARSMLDIAAHDAAMAPRLAEVLDNRQDTKQFALEVLSIGAAISMVIIAANSTFGPNGYGKEALSPELAAKLGGWLDSLKPWFKSPGA